MCAESPIGNDQYDHKVVEVAARAVVKKNPGWMRMVKKPFLELASDLATAVWEERDKWIPSKSQLKTFATMVCGRRMQDMADKATTTKAQLNDGTIEPPAPVIEPNELITDFRSTVIACQTLDIKINNIAELMKNSEDADEALRARWSMFAYQDARKSLVGEYLPIKIGSVRYTADLLHITPERE